MAFLKDQAAALEVESILVKAAEQKLTLLLSVINWGEIYYSVMRAESQKIAEQKVAEIAAFPLELVPVDKDLQLVRQAAIYKATRKMSYADCFAAALAKTRHVPLITGDAEFKAVEDEVRIDWL